MLARIIETYGDDIQFVYRHYPLSFHDKAIITAEASEAAGAQGAFWGMHDILFARYSDWAGLAPEAMPELLADYAQELGLDVDRFSQELEQHVYQERVENSYEESTNLRAPGTPTFIVNGRMFPFGAGLSEEALRLFIDTSLELATPFDSPPPQVVDANRTYHATLHTAQGDVVIELYGDRAPANVNSFVFLAREGQYDGTTFLQVTPDFAVLAGDPSGTGLVMDHGYWCDLEIVSDLSFNEVGTVGLNSATRRTSSIQFFINTTPQPTLDGSYTIIGRVIEGLDVLTALEPRDPRDPEAPPGETIESITIEEQ
ncbi:MAG: peptidylprolyl isomerase [Anaerolineae bacterium]|nr:peptidylprolyl isomerase [Anaerolineae bacterium]